MTPKEIAAVAAKAMDSKKGADISVLDINRLTTLGDYFVICTGASGTQIRAIADEVTRLLEEKGVKPLHIEGYASSSWVLIDFGTVVAHIFHRETREFYGLERLWADATYHNGVEFSNMTGDGGK